jgi:hypothetical protein
MNANSENDAADELDDDEVEEVLDGDDVDLDRVYKDMESAKRRVVKGGEPAWRILEQRMERKHTAELISDFEDYDIDNIDVPLLAARR